MPLDICGIFLGRLYLYDKKGVFFQKENKYRLTKDGVEYIVRTSFCSKGSLTLILIHDFDLMIP